MMNDEVRTIMKKDPFIAHPKEDAKDIANYMITHQIRHVAIVECGQFIGMLSTSDFWKQTMTNKGLAGKRLKDLMNTQIVKVAPKDKIGTAIELLVGTQHISLPVVNLRGELKGIVSAFDILKKAFTDTYSNSVLFPDMFNANEVRPEAGNTV